MKKFKPRRTGWNILILALVVILVVTSIIFGEAMFDLVFAVINALFVPAYCLVYFRTRNHGHLIATLYYTCLSVTFFMPADSGSRTFLAIPTSVLLILYLFILFSKRLNWRYREILEMAAQPVNDAKNGFSSRPFQISKGIYTKNEILTFARFIMRHVIAFSIIEENRLVLVLPKNMFSYMIFFKKDYRQATHVIFDFKGNITVSMARKDYEQYVEEWTFDQLCESLGNIFKRFLALHQEGKKDEIIAVLNNFKSAVNKSNQGI
jgi:hypothetical protein